jgi:3-hydroxybutyryl-CoA dehydrogenase
MEIGRVGIVGMGTMGSQIGIVVAQAGYETFMADISRERVEEGLRIIGAFLDGRVKKGKIDKDAKTNVLSSIRASSEIAEAASQCDLVIEAVFEDIEVKKDVFAQLDSVCPPHSILATNTSTLWVTEIASATSRPDKCIGTHFLIPAALTRMVEVVRGIDTSESTYESVLSFLGKCGKETVTVVDSPGFVINRLYLPMVNEAFMALESGLASAEEIDRSCTLGLGLPLGPLAAADTFGLDILLACMETFRRELGDKYRPSPLLVKLVKAGHLGRKTGRGVYRYST